MRSIFKTLLGGVAGTLVLAGAALAQPTANQSPNPTPIRKPADAPLAPDADPTRPVSPPLAPLPDPAAPGAPVDPLNPAIPTEAPPPVPVAPSQPTTVDVAPSAGALVVADDASLGETDSLSYAWNDTRLASGIGVSAILGGGVTGFTDKTMRNTTADVGGLWDLRVTIGSHIPLALDLSYIGTATNLRGLSASRSGTLLGTTAEAALRYNILPHAAWNPYIFGGVGWQRYDVTQTNVSLSDSGMNDKDNLLEFPMGAGLQYRMGGFVGDVRGTFRATTDQNLVLTNTVVNPTSSDFAEMHTWEASAAVGYEF